VRANHLRIGRGDHFSRSFLSFFRGGIRGSVADELRSDHNSAQQQQDINLGFSH
jgi:hypothetical protein